jgi:hypothetical protein
VGEAPGWRGCAVTGVPFTSEALIASGAIPRVSDLWMAMGRPRLSLDHQPGTEATATIVWKVLHKLGLAETTICWNACPWHPHLEGNPLSNRAPFAREVDAGLEPLRLLLEAFPGVATVGVGAVAARSLLEARRPVEGAIGQVRHPSYGGASLFAEGLATAKRCAHPR